MASFHETLCCCPVFEGKQFSRGLDLASLLRPCCLISMALKKLSSAPSPSGLQERKACSHPVSIMPLLLVFLYPLQIGICFWLRKLSGQKFGQDNNIFKSVKNSTLSNGLESTDSSVFYICKALFVLLLQNIHSLSERSYQNPFISAVTWSFEP